MLTACVVPISGSTSKFNTATLLWYVRACSPSHVKTRVWCFIRWYTSTLQLFTEQITRTFNGWRQQLGDRSSFSIRPSNYLVWMWSIGELQVGGHVHHSRCVLTIIQLWALATGSWTRRHVVGLCSNAICTERSVRNSLTAWTTLSDLKKTPSLDVLLVPGLLTRYWCSRCKITLCNGFIHTACDRCIFLQKEHK